MSNAIVALTLLAWVAYIASRLVRGRGLPELVAFLVVGAALGPSGAGVIEETDLHELRFVTDLALAALMFIIGERVSLRALRAEPVVAWTGLAQYAACGALVFFTSRWLGGSQPVALLLAVLAGAGAPMTVASVASSVRAHGAYTRRLIGAHAAADALAALAFAAALPTAVLLSDPGGRTGDAVLGFLQRGAGGALLGLVLGWVVARLASHIETSGELLVFALVHVLAAAAMSAALGLSLPLVALVMGAAAASLTPRSTAQRLFVAVRGIEQPLYLVFFGLAGASMHLDALPELGLLGAGYVVARVVGKLAGGVVGGVLGGTGIRRAGRLGVDLLPQAGVAVGLAVRGAESLPGAGRDAATIVLGSVVLFELVGPLLVSRSLKREAEAPVDEESTSIDGDDLPRRILVAAAGPPQLPAWVLGLCAHSGSELWLLSPGDGDGDGDGDALVQDVRDRAAEDNVPFHWLPLNGQSFTRAVVRAAADVDADVVVVAAATDRRRSARLLVHPHERVAREVTCPVVLLPPPAAPLG